MRLILIAFLAMTGVAHATGEKVAFFGLTFLNSSPEEIGEASPEMARIQMLEDLVRATFLEQGYVLMDLGPVQKDIDRIVNPAKCYGCDTRMAAKLGADFSLVGEVQKVSNLIIAMNLQMRDAETGELVKGRVVDIRSNTDDSWLRGMRYILKNTFFREKEG